MPACLSGGRDRSGLRALVPGEGVIDDLDELKAYETDALTATGAPPMIVVLLETTAQVSAVLTYCHRNRRQGGAARRRHLAFRRRAAAGRRHPARPRQVQPHPRDRLRQPLRDTSPGRHSAISNAVAERGFYYAPDPSSQIACSIGGNVAENAGAVHCLKYGLTTNNVLGVEMVLINGEVVRLAASTWTAKATTCWASSPAPRACWRPHRSDVHHPQADNARAAGRLRRRKRPVVASPT